MIYAYDHITLRELDGNVEIPPPTSALEEWYIEVRDKRLSEFSVDELTRACRQQLYLDAIVPLCLLELETDPMAGDMYDGELMDTVSRIPIEYWESHPLQSLRFQQLSSDTP